MHRLCSLKHRGSAVYAQLCLRLTTRIRNGKCNAKHKFLGNTITEEQFGQVVKDLNSKHFTCYYHTAEGIVCYFSR